MKNTMGSHVWMDILKWDTENKLAKKHNNNNSKDDDDNNKKS